MTKGGIMNPMQSPNTGVGGRDHGHRDHGYRDREGIENYNNYRNKKNRKRKRKDDLND